MGGANIHTFYPCKTVPTAMDGYDRPQSVTSLEAASSSDIEVYKAVLDCHVCI